MKSQYDKKKVKMKIKMKPSANLLIRKLHKEMNSYKKNA